MQAVEGNPRLSHLSLKGSTLLDTGALALARTLTAQAAAFSHASHADTHPTQYLSAALGANSGDAYQLGTLGADHNGSQPLTLTPLNPAFDQDASGDGVSEVFRPRRLRGVSASAGGALMGGFSTTASASLPSGSRFQTPQRATMAATSGGGAVPSSAPAPAATALDLQSALANGDGVTGVFQPRSRSHSRSHSFATGAAGHGGQKEGNVGFVVSGSDHDVSTKQSGQHAAHSRDTQNSNNTHHQPDAGISMHTRSHSHLIVHAEHGGHHGSSSSDDDMHGQGSHGEHAGWRSAREDHAAGSYRARPHRQTHDTHDMDGQEHAWGLRELNLRHTLLHAEGEFFESIWCLLLCAAV